MIFAKIRNQKIKDYIKPATQEEIAAYVKGVIHRNGLRQVPSIFPAAGIVTAGGVAGALYEPLIISLGQPRVMETVLGFIDGFTPGVPKTPIGSGIMILKESYDQYGYDIFP